MQDKLKFMFRVDNKLIGCAIVSILDVGKEYKFIYSSQIWDKNKYSVLSSVDDKEIKINSNELTHAIVTCGMPAYYLTSNVTKNRQDELRFKSALIEMALTIDENNYLVLNEKKLKYLDSSERSVISYYNRFAP